MNGLTTKDAADQWGITPRQVQLLCAQGRIPGAVRFGHAWVIPVDAKKPEDQRSKRKNMSEDEQP
ncbi:MAG: helix-turn-helix domain-containing protein [Clostridiaceae bacterium]|nr:helix-turn-helix domain-containing protein [Clostridiaceae bacterium]